MQLNASQYIAIMLVIIISEYLLTTFIDLLNSAKDSGKVPNTLQGFYKEEKYQKALSYHKENTYFGLISGFVSLLIILLVISFGILGVLDEYLTHIFQGLIGQTLAFFAVIFLLNDLLNIPFQLYATFKIEEKYGFNNTSLQTFFVDKFKGYLFAMLVGGILLSILILLISNLGHAFWWIFWLVIGGFMVAANFFYTSWVVPIFNNLTPLEEGELKDAIVSYGQSVDFPIASIYVMDGSKRSSKANAYFSGFGNRKKVVLYDTLVQNYSKEELVAILAHEVGHYKLKHTVSGMISGIIQVGIMLFIMSMMIFDPFLSEALGTSRLSFGVNLIAFGIIYTPISLLTGLLGNYMSRKHEFEADAYAVKTFHSAHLASALKKLSVDNLSNLRPHKLYVFFHYSHPPLLKRLSAIERRR